MVPSDPQSDDAAGAQPAGELDVDQGALHHASRRLLRRSRFFLDAAHPILVRDGEGRVVDLDNEAIRSLGWNRDELIGRPFEQAFAPEWRDALESLLQRCRAGEEVRDEEGMLWTRQEERIPVLLSLSRLPGESRDVPTIAATARDVEDLRISENETRRTSEAVDQAKQDEKRNLGSALHDTIGQILPLARMKLAELREDLPPALREKLDEVDRLISDADLRARTLMFQLDTAVLHDIGIGAAAHELADELHEHYGLRVAVEDDGRWKPLSAAQRTALFRGLRELLVNVARHAQTDAATVRIGSDDRWVWVLVEDPGRGFEPSLRGFGLRSVEDRIARVGGRFESDSAPGQGARLRMAVPIMAPASGGADRR